MLVVMYAYVNVYECKYAWIYEAKIADDVNEGIENALNIIVSTTGSSGNIKKELKNIIFDTVNNIR